MRKFSEIIKICKFLSKILTKNEITELCKGVHCVDLGESFQTHIYLQNLASIQPRTSPLKFVRSSGKLQGWAPALWLPQQIRRRMKIELNFPPNFEARSRLYRRRFLQLSTRWKALDEIYKIYILLHRSDLKISAKNRHHVFANE